MNRRAIREGRVVLFREYIEDQNQVLGSLVVDFNPNTHTAWVREPAIFRLGFSYGVARNMLSQRLDLNEHFICFLEIGTKIVKGIERRILKAAIKSGSGEEINLMDDRYSAHFFSGYSQRNGRVLVLRHIDQGRLKAAPITNQKPGNCLVVGAPKEYITTVQENILKDISSRARSNDIWPIGTLTEGQITKISEVKKGKIYKE